LIVFDASSLVGAAIGADSVPRRAVQKARMQDRFAMSTAVFDEVIEVLHRPRLARFVDPALRDDLLDLLIPGRPGLNPPSGLRTAGMRRTTSTSILRWLPRRQPSSAAMGTCLRFIRGVECGS